MRPSSHSAVLACYDKLRHLGFKGHAARFVSGDADLVGVVLSFSRPLAIERAFVRMLRLLSHEANQPRLNPASGMGALQRK
ncbi:hypothetical protein X739_28015 [Mesorhizobium sp. LNHC220B00]|nr:hypothetical protein X739_28015 [Mesorhizobium sp. LNHC220B00]